MRAIRLLLGEAAKNVLRDSMARNIAVLTEQAATLRAELETLKHQREKTAEAFAGLSADYERQRVELERAQEKLNQFESYGITVASALADRDELERVTKERDEARTEANMYARHIERRSAGMDPLTKALRERAESAEAQVAALKADLAAAEKAVDDFEEERDRARAELEQKTRALEKYGRHQRDCPADDWDALIGRCACGFATLAAPTEGEKP